VLNWEGVVKAELHVHLFGAIPPRVLLELAHRHRVALPADTVEGLGKWLRFSDFAGFEEAFVTIGPCVQTADDMELIGREFARELSSQRVRYAEVMISPAAVADAGIEISQQLEVLDSVRIWASDELEVDLRWIFDINRSLPDTRRRLRAADLTLEAALAGRAQGVVALGLSSAEAGHPPEQFAPWFERALAAGLHSVPHAGEHAGPESVWGAINALGAERIAHGVRAIVDPALITYLAEHQIALDVCPTSNVCLGVYPSLAEPPLRRLMAAGVPVTVNSDDPTMFGVTLNDEVAMLSSEHGLDDGAISEILANPPHEAGFAGTPDGFRFGFETHAAV
jgi:aminodeoxyfutalosine deaminase